MVAARAAVQVVKRIDSIGRHSAAAVREWRIGVSGLLLARVRSQTGQEPAVADPDGVRGFDDTAAHPRVPAEAGGV
jgi:hypothetical protein